MIKKSFSHKDYTRDLIREELNRLHYVDGYPFAALSKMTEISESKLRAVSQGDRTFEDWEVVSIMRETAKDGNIRFLNMVLPGHDAPAPNGEIKDEIGDAVNSLSKANIGHATKNKYATIEAAEELRQIADRIEKEAKIL